MKRVISTNDTFFYKIILPVFFLVCSAVVPALIYFDDRKIFAAILPTSVYSNGRNGRFVGCLFLFIFLIGTSLLFFLMTKASKKLSLDGDVLYASNFIKEIAIPPSNIEKILWFGDVRPTLIYLKEQSPFGRKITFYPNVKATSSTSNPIVEELKQWAKL